MAKLEIKTAGLGHRVIELRLGVNRLGRAEDNDVQLEHPSVSATHCELLLGCGPIAVRDCGSTNGTFVDGAPVQTATLRAGQTLRLGGVELLLADAQVPVSIPRFDRPVAAPPKVLSKGAVACRCRRAAAATYRCQHCGELLCEQCIHRLRRRGGNLLRLCPLCSYPVLKIGEEPRKRKSFLSRLRETTRLLFTRTAITRN